MSWPALGWASKQRPGRVADKMVLIALADRHNEEADMAYPSIAWLAEFSCLDRKTVVAALDRLERAGLIADSGIRYGKTKQVKGYRLALNSPEKGDPKTEPLEGNSPVFSGKESQKRDTDTSSEPSPKGDTLKKSKSPKMAPPAKPDDVSDQTWGDFLRHRKVKRADVSATVLSGIRKEARIAGWSMEAALAETVARGWQGFKAEWVAKAANDSGGGSFLSSLGP